MADINARKVMENFRPLLLRELPDIQKYIESRGLDIRMLSDAKIEKYADQMEKEQRQAEKIRMLKERIAEFPEKYSRFKIRDFERVTSDGTKVKSAVDYLLSGKSGIVVGINGVGKTSMAYTCWKKWLYDGESALVTTLTKLLGNITQLVWVGRRQIDEVIASEFGLTIRHLVIDEADKPVFTGKEKEWLIELVGHRYNYGLQTVFMGNGTVDEMHQQLGDAITSRITGEGGFAVVMGGANRRNR